jgi:polysaccharide pyruvyl transferase CsaB
MRPDRADIPRVAVVGFQGFGNVGDEAILMGIEVLIGARMRVATVFTGGRDVVIGFPAAARVRTARHLPTITAWRALRRADALVISGGGLINDYWLTVIPRYVAWCLVGRLAGCRVVWIGAGVGPIRRRPWRWLAGLAFMASRIVLVRDNASEGWVRRCYRGTTVRVIADPAFFLPTVPTGDAEPSGVAIVARGPTPADAALTDDLVRSLAKVATTTQARGERVELISMHPAEDRAFVASVQRAIGESCGTALRVTWLPPDPAEALALFGTFDRLLTVRLHGLILGALAGVPSVAIGYDQKVIQAAKLLGLGDVAVAVDGATASALQDALDRVAGDPSRRQHLRDAVHAIRSTQASVVALVVGAVSR